jgi:hypothetical protein
MSVDMPAMIMLPHRELGLGNNKLTSLDGVTFPETLK